MELDEFRKENNKQRIEWIKMWVEYMKKNSNEVWSRQQADLINSVMRSANMNPDNYLEIKKLIQKK
jgi:hypothetical protein